MTTFAELGLSDAVLAAVDHLGYTEPTPVQAQAIPLVLQGRDIIAAAKTGTGKTAAFSLPSLDVLARAERKKAPAMLVITPTRELAMQIQEVCQTIARTRGLRVANVVGGVKIEPQIDRLARGVDVLIATPGRLIDLMNQKAVDLSQVQVLVLDEADRMLDMGFLPSVRRIVEATLKAARHFCSRPPSTRACSTRWTPPTTLATRRPRCGRWFGGLLVICMASSRRWG